MKKLILGIALAVTLVAAYFAPQETESVQVVGAKQAPRVSQDMRLVSTVDRPRASGPAALQIRSRNSDQDLGDMFAARTWTSEMKPASAKPGKEPALAPAAPEVPPLPFRFLGRMVQEGDTIYFLQFNDRNLAMRIGDAVDKTYTLDSANGGTLTFTYLPQSAKQTLAVGEVN